MDMQISTSKNRMRAFRARRALVDTAEQKDSHLAIDRQYRKQWVADFRVKKTNEEKHTHLISRSQYEVNRLAGWVLCLKTYDYSFVLSQRNSSGKLSTALFHTLILKNI
jgi:hypothetical protein